VTSNYVLSSIVLPPTSLALLALFALALWKSRPRLALALIAGSQVTMLALAMPVVANALARTLEPAPVTAEALKRAQAIVILGGGINRSAIDWGGVTVNDFTLQRLRYGARLSRESGLPVYVTGGVPPSASVAEGPLMADVLARDFGVSVRWIDRTAETTRENALMAAKDLKPQGIQRIALVTTAIHMPRSRQAFEAAGFTVSPAPTDYAGQRPFDWYQLIPGPRALRLSHLSLREWISRGYYWLLGS
jgi:uncharacterized SAM-binding protein YcdF (DUF218 family)